MILKNLLYIIILIIFYLGLTVKSPVAEGIDDQVREISHALMCPVCRGQTVDESNSELAKDMREVIKRKLQQGESKEEIMAYFVERYGERILGAPPVKGTNWLIWLLPGIALMAGGTGIAVFLRRSKGEKKEFGGSSEEPIVQTEREYADRLEKELKEFES